MSRIDWDGAVRRQRARLRTELRVVCFLASPLVSWLESINHRLRRVELAERIDINGEVRDE